MAEEESYRFVDFSGVDDETSAPRADNGRYSAAPRRFACLKKMAQRSLYARNHAFFASWDQSRRFWDLASVLPALATRDYRQKSSAVAPRAGRRSLGSCERRVITRWRRGQTPSCSRPQPLLPPASASVSAAVAPHATANSKRWPPRSRSASTILCWKVASMAWGA